MVIDVLHPGKATVPKTEIQEKLIPDSINRLLDDFARYAEMTGKIFKRNVTANISLTEDIQIPMNRQLVQRALSNLFTNALRYTKENDTIEVNAFNKVIDKDNFMIIEIKDTGKGIDKKDLDYIFDIFYRGTNSRQEEGMGIGLAVVKSIIETHGWNISVDSQKNKGSCFTIKIPC